MLVQKRKKRPGHMIHVRLNEDEHRRLRVVIAEKRTTIQRFVSELVKRELDARHVK